MGSSKPFHVVCAWCGVEEQRESMPRALHPAAPISHTICDACFVRESAQLQTEQLIRVKRKGKASA